MQYTYNLEDAKEYIQRVTSAIVEKINPEKVILFGSYAYGKPTSKSDIDILVIIKDSPLGRIERSGQLYHEMREYFRNYSIDFVVYTEMEVLKWANAELAFITSVIKKGKILYERKS